MEPFGCALFELKLIQRRRRTRQNVVQIEKRVFRSRTFLDQFTETQVIAKFRLSSPMIHSLYDEIHLALETRTRRSNAVPGLVRFLAVLHFLGKASYQHVSGEIVGISQPSFSRCLVEVLQALRQLAPKYIHMGKLREERDQIKRVFFDNSRNVSGNTYLRRTVLLPFCSQNASLQRYLTILDVVIITLWDVKITLG